MFRDRYAHLDEDRLAQAIKDDLLAQFGYYPILDVSETWEIEDEDMDEPIVLRDYHALLDTEQLDKLNGFELSYVQFLFEKIIDSKLRQGDKAKDLLTSASKKYCFSDTEEWWKPIEVETVPEGRERFELIVNIGG